MSIDVETGSPLSDAGGVDVSEKPDKLEVWCQQLEAAEERGRRRGVIAQWGKIHELLALVDELADDLAPFTGERVGAKWNRLRAGIEDLAPRDSAPAIPSVASQGCLECSKPQPGDLGMGSIEARQLRCPHAKYKPRDSAPVGTCVGHLGPPSNTGQPHPRGSTCSYWKEASRDSGKVP